MTAPDTCDHPSRNLSQTGVPGESQCGLCGKKFMCPHPWSPHRVHGPTRQGQVGAFCDVCELRVPCPHPVRYEDNRVNPSMQKAPPGKCKWCNDSW